MQKRRKLVPGSWGPMECGHLHSWQSPYAEALGTAPISQVCREQWIKLEKGRPLGSAEPVL